MKNGKGEVTPRLAPTPLTVGAQTLGHLGTHLCAAVGLGQVQIFLSLCLLICKMGLTYKAFHTIPSCKEVSTNRSYRYGCYRQKRTGEAATSPTCWGQGWTGPRPASSDNENLASHFNEKRWGTLCNGRATSVHFLVRAAAGLTCGA